MSYENLYVHNHFMKYIINTVLHTSNMAILRHSIMSKEESCHLVATVGIKTVIKLQIPQYDFYFMV